MKRVYVGGALLATAVLVATGVLASQDSTSVEAVNGSSPQLATFIQGLASTAEGVDVIGLPESLSQELPNVSIRSGQRVTTQAGVVVGTISAVTPAYGLRWDDGGRQVVDFNDPTAEGRLAIATIQPDADSESTTRGAVQVWLPVTGADPSGQLEAVRNQWGRAVVALGTQGWQASYPDVWLIDGVHTHIGRVDAAGNFDFPAMTSPDERAFLGEVQSLDDLAKVADLPATTVTP